MQATQNDLSVNQCDVMVLGGGPAGSAISTCLAEKGYKVVMVEKEKHPRFHIGESMLPMSMPLFERLGVVDQVEEIGIRKYGADFHSLTHEGGATYSFANALDQTYEYAHEIKRSELDEVLFRNAAKKGVETHEETRATDVHFDIDHNSYITTIDKNNNEKRWHAKFLVDATGRSTLLANKFNIKSRNKKHNSAVIFGHFENVIRRTGKEEGNIALCWFKHGWFWMIPFKDGSVSVGAVCWPYYLNSRNNSVEEFFWDTVKLCPEVQRRMNDAKLITPITATGNFSYSASHMAGNGYLMVGDAFAFIDPVFSSGVLLALNSGVRGADLVDKVLKDPANSKKAIKEYDRTVRKGLRIFSWFIYRITQPAMQRMFMERTVQREIREKGITSLLAGDLFHDTPVLRYLAVFKTLYYVYYLRNLLANVKNVIVRKRGLKGGRAIVEDVNFRL